jgi:ribosome recycling factor
VADNDVIKDFLDEARGRMKKSVEATRTEFSTVRTGRASPHLLDRIEVDYYGAVTPLKQLAQVSATEARLLTITPYDKNSIKAIEKSILESDVGLTPSNDGQVIRLQIPELTEERRRELVKVVHGIAELKSEGEVGSDDEHRAETELQKLTDSHVGEIDTALAGKEEEILEV